MDRGFQIIAQVSATLFGLVLVAIQFAFNAARSRAENAHEIRDYAWWVWTSGFYCCLCYIYCFLVSTSLMVGKFNFTTQLIGAIVITALLITVKVVEIVLLHRQVQLDRIKFRIPYTVDLTTALVVLPVILALIWVAVLGRHEGTSQLEHMYTALRWLVAIISIRAVVLISMAFQVNLKIQQLSGMKDCPSCTMRIPSKATRCPYCSGVVLEVEAQTGLGTDQ